MKREIVLGLIFLGAAAGCLTSVGYRRGCQVRVGNRSGIPVGAVVFDAGGESLQFGYTAAAVDGWKTAGGCGVDFSRSLAIEWMEDGMMRRFTFDLTKYKAKRARIRSLSCFYLGDGIWEIVAQDDILPDSKVIEP